MIEPQRAQRKRRLEIGLVGLWLLFGVTLLLLVFELGQTAVSVRGKSAPLPLETTVTAGQQQAQALALADARVQQLTNGQRSEVFGVRRMGQQFTQASAACATAVCYQVEIYSFDENFTVTAVVDTDAGVVRDVLHQPQMQPGINQRLANRALELAFNDPGVIAALGFRPTQADMAPVAAGLRGTACDQGHLCAGPTFRLGNRILWAIVDLTTETVAGLRWTTVIDDGSTIPYQPEGGFCPEPGSVGRDGWALSYETTGTDGLRIYNVTYQGRTVLTSASLPEWHVDYNGEYYFPGFVDVTGCGGTGNDGGGFPIPAKGETEVRDLLDGSTVVGFEVVQDFRMGQWGAACNYRYDQRYQFWGDGRFRIVVGAYGRGCGDDPAMQQPVYRPVVRIDIAVDGDENDNFAIWEDQQWLFQPTETYRTPYESAGFGPHQLHSNNAAWLVMDAGGAGFYIEPGLGQFNDGGKDDQPFIYITLHNPDEGDTDLPSFGSSTCCIADHQQGPDRYVNGEPIANANLVLWYVAQSTTDRVPAAEDGDGLFCWTVNGGDNPETYPCFAGPMFTPFGFDGGGVSANFDVNPTVLGFPETAVFSNSTIITGNIPVNTSWDFGDGRTAVDDRGTFAVPYLVNGVFTPTLTVDAFVWGVDTAVGPAITVNVENVFLPLVERP